MSDAYLVPLHASEHTRDFRKPVTVAALREFDSDLELIRNRRTMAFEVHRRVKRARSYWWAEHDTWLSFYEPMLIYVCDWKLGLVGSDDPSSLIAYLERSDIRRHPDLAAAGEYEIFWQREQISRKVAGLFRDAFRENRAQLYKAWQPLVNSPALVR